MYRRALRKKSRSESIRQTFGVVAVGALLGTGLFAIADYFTVQHWVKPATAARNAGEIYTGSVLYMPQEGRNCHQMLFDNHTGRFTDNGSGARHRRRVPPALGSSDSPDIAIGRPRDFGYSPRRPGQQVSGVSVWRSSNGF